jgi:tetratricopeptide (TPR) repeat protein
MRCPQGVVKSCFVVALVAGLAGVAGCNKLRSRDLLNKGVQAYKLGQFDQAEEDFKQSAKLDPTLLTARIYLATAYASQFVPGSPSPENTQKGEQAIVQFKKVLELDPKNVSAIDGIGSMLFNMGTTPYDPKMLEQSRSYHQKHIAMKPDDPQPYYWVGVIDWTLSFRENQKLRKDYNANLPRRAKPIKVIDPLPEKLRDQLASQYQQTVDEGIDALQKAIQLNPDYADAMAYLNLLYRQKADMVTDKAQREDLEKQADALVDKVKEIKEKESSAPKAK